LSIFATLLLIQAEENARPWSDSSISPIPEHSVEFDTRWVEESPRAVPYDNGLGKVRAQYAPFSNFQSGRHWLRGLNSTVRFYESASVTSRGALHFRPRLEIDYARSGNSQAGLKVESLYALAKLWNVEVRVGRDHLVWGPTDEGGLEFSNNALPLDMIKISAAEPFQFPWLFRYLGPTQAVFFVARSEGGREMSNAYVYGLFLAIHPFRNFEFGGSQSIWIGGKGARSKHVYWADPITEFLHIRHGPFDPGPQSISDHRIGFHLRLHLPDWGNSTFYAQTLFEDIVFEGFDLNFTERMAYLTGLKIRRIGALGSWSFKTEFRSVPARLFRHESFTDGHSRYERSIGSPLNSDSMALLAALRYRQNERWSYGIQPEYEWARAHTYRQVLTSSGNAGKAIRLNSQPEERRLRIRLDTHFRFSPRWKLKWDGAYEHIDNFAFAAGRSRHHWMMGTSILYQFSRDTLSE